ncbi:MAG: sulfate reduction electron transfer complex DsrMKJOP subunit DsrO [Peptococcaceae bacterium]
MRLGMVIDLKRCVGCQACVAACKVEHGTPEGTYFTKVLKYERGSYPNARLINMPRLCQHCAEASCVKACPTGASRHLENGIVMIDHSLCIGCRYCMAACPYNARSFIHNTRTGLPGGSGEQPAPCASMEKGTVSKCNFCQERVKEGRKPSCVETCPAGARFFGDLDDPHSEISVLAGRANARQLYPEAGTDPKVFYLE